MVQLHCVNDVCTAMNTPTTCRSTPKRQCYAPHASKEGMTAPPTLPTTASWQPLIAWQSALSWRCGSCDHSVPSAMPCDSRSRCHVSSISPSFHAIVIIPPCRSRTDSGGSLGSSSVSSTGCFASCHSPSMPFENVVRPAYCAAHSVGPARCQALACHH